METPALPPEGFEISADRPTTIVEDGSVGNAGGAAALAPAAAPDLSKLPRKARREIERQQRLEAAERALVDLLEEHGVAVQISPILEVGADSVVRMKFRMNLVHNGG